MTHNLCFCLYEISLRGKFTDVEYRLLVTSSWGEGKNSEWPFIEYESESVNHSVMSNSLWSHGLQPSRFLCPWNSPGKNTGAGCHFLLQESSWPRDRTQVSCIAGRFFTVWAGYLFRLMKIFLNWMVMMVIQYFECTQSHWTVYFKIVKIVNCRWGEF